MPAQPNCRTVSADVIRAHFSARSTGPSVTSCSATRPGCIALPERRRHGQNQLPSSATAISEWNELLKTRAELDGSIIDWAEALDPKWLEGDLTWYSGAMGREVSKPKWALVTHMFNHQTHHRGQVHCMLTQAGVKPEDTDLPFMPAHYG